MASSWPATPIRSTSSCPPRATPRPIAAAPVPLAWRLSANLRGRPHRHHPHLRRHPGTVRQLRPHRLQGHGARQGTPQPVDPRHRHAHFLGARHPEPHAPSRNRPAQPRQPAPAGDVRLRQGDHRAPRCSGPSAVGIMHLGDKTILQVGERSFCWMYENGHAKRIEVETGVSDGEWIEVTHRRAQAPIRRTLAMNPGRRSTAPSR